MIFHLRSIYRTIIICCHQFRYLVKFNYIQVMILSCLTAVYIYGWVTGNSVGCFVSTNCKALAICSMLYILQGICNTRLDCYLILDFNQIENALIF